MNKFISLKPKKGPRKERKKILYGNASELYQDYLEICFNQYMPFSGAKKRKLHNKYDPTNLFFETHHYDAWLESDLPSILAL